MSNVQILKKQQHEYCFYLFKMIVYIVEPHNSFIFKQLQHLTITLYTENYNTLHGIRILNYNAPHGEL
jgi:hypothetical protein